MGDGASQPGVAAVGQRVDFERAGMMQSTRQEILEILKEEGQATVEDLAQRLELTPMTIRHHLNVLQAQSMVEASQVRRSQQVGRPRLVYTLTESAQELFPQNYGNLALHLVREVKDVLGREETEAVFRRIAARVAQEAPSPRQGQDFEERLAEVVEFLGERGFIAHWEKSERGYVLTNINCPYRQVTREHGEVCIMDQELIAQLLGVQPVRLGDIHQEGACVYLVAEPA
jgi:predicted ArsR family transcriptional regulator